MNRVLYCVVAFTYVSLANAADIKVLQYNILASYLGSNLEPWFLYGKDLTNATAIKKRENQQRQVLAKMYEKKEGKFVNDSFRECLTPEALIKDKPSCQTFKGIFSDDELKNLHEYDVKFFSWDKRKEKIITAIKEQKPDIISLVELDDLEYIKQELGHYGYDFLKRPRSNSFDGAGIFYLKNRFEPKEEIKLTYKDNDRVALLVKFHDKTANRDFLFASTHLMREPDDMEKEAIRVEEIEQLLNKIKQVRVLNPELPVIVAGDFNALPSSSTYNAMTAAGFHAPAFQGQDCTSKTLARSVWIDYILMKNFSHILGKPKQVDCQSPSVVWPNEQEGSDHVPVVAEVSY